jgi:sugar lactone lactonase YvrE
MKGFVRQAAFVFLLPVAVLILVVAMSCSYDSTMPYQQPPEDSIDGLWTASASDPAILRLDKSQLLASGDRTPATKIQTNSAALFNLNGVAFDSDGTLWVTSQDDSMLVAFNQSALGSSGSRVARTVIKPINSSLSEPIALAFDKQHRLWVANSNNGTLVRFDRAQLDAGGSQVPAVVIQSPTRPSALAFDAAGFLWVSNGRTNRVFAYSPAQLAASGAPTPQIVISSNGPSLASPAGIAFDAAGNLWVGNIGNQTVVAYSPVQLAVTGTPAPSVVLSPNAGSLGIPAGLAFDSDGSLWVVGGAGLLEKFPRASLAATGAPAPSVTLRFTGFILFYSAAFWPTPAGLPLN